MSTATVARPTASKDAHWYTTKAEPMHEIMGKTTGKMRPVNIADARELNLVPGVSTILKCANKEGLNLWRIEQAVLACVTSPRGDKEELDAYVKRILQVDKVHEEEGKIARDKGIEIHEALALLFEGQAPNKDIAPWVMPAFEAIQGRGPVHGTEVVLVGHGYAGRADLILGAGNQFEMWDFKSSKKLPDPKKGGAWPEHKLQLSAYAKAFGLGVEFSSAIPAVTTANLYISTTEEGKFVICEHDDWVPTWSHGFRPLLEYWGWLNNFWGAPAVDAEAPLVASKPGAPPPSSRKVRMDVGVRTQIVAPGPMLAVPPPPMPVKQ